MDNIIGNQRIIRIKHGMFNYAVGQQVSLGGDTKAIVAEIIKDEFELRKGNNTYHIYVKTDGGVFVYKTFENLPVELNYDCKNKDVS